MAFIIIPILTAGIFFFMIGVIGLLRLPDAYSRMHATTKCDTLGAGLILFALALYALYTGFPATSIKLILLIIFVWVTNPTSAHVIARAAYRSNDAPLCEGSFSMDKTEGGAKS
ncbi:MAG: monovalent cation/H(+) antiporter subunit G [Dethiobacter sp.]|jgi:multicomponent Na+:H+ antiporter subunit G|nr:monovalent cation/H(+) antiporter subunit G [Dethiobacter sp.]